MITDYNLVTLDRLEQTFSLSNNDLLYILGTDNDKTSYDRYKASANSVMLTTFIDYLLNESGKFGSAAKANIGPNSGDVVTLNSEGNININFLPLANGNSAGIVKSADENIVISSGNISLNSELSNITKISSVNDLVIDVGNGSLRYKGQNIDSSLVHNRIIGKTPPNIDINLTDGNNPIYNLGTINSDNSDITIIPPANDNNNNNSAVYAFKLLFVTADNATSLSLHISGKTYKERIIVEPDVAYYISVNIIQVDNNTQYLFVSDIQNTSTSQQ